MNIAVGTLGATALASSSALAHAMPPTAPSSDQVLAAIERTVQTAAVVPPADGNCPAASLSVAPGPDSGLLELGVRWGILCSQYHHLLHVNQIPPDDELDAIWDEMKAIERTIALLQARTTTGILVKAHITEHCLSVDLWDEKDIPHDTEETISLWMARSAMRDLIALMAGTDPV